MKVYGTSTGKSAFVRRRLGGPVSRSRAVKGFFSIGGEVPERIARLAEVAVQLGSTPASDLVEHGGEVAIECRRARCGVAVSRSKRPLQ